jgi:hypothetical protein
MKEKIISISIITFSVSLIICLIGYYYVPSPKSSIGEGLFISIILSIVIGLIGGVIGLIIFLIKPSILKKQLENNEKKLLEKERVSIEEVGGIETKQEQTKYNKTAITSIILSIISIFGIGLAGLIGFILGITALIQIKHSKERGKSVAIAAIIIGFIWSFITSILKQLVKLGY